MPAFAFGVASGDMVDHVFRVTGRYGPLTKREPFQDATITARMTRTRDGTYYEAAPDKKHAAVQIWDAEFPPEVIGPGWTLEVHIVDESNQKQDLTPITDLNVVDSGGGGPPPPLMVARGDDAGAREQTSEFPELPSHFRYTYPVGRDVRSVTAAFGTAASSPQGTIFEHLTGVFEAKLDPLHPEAVFEFDLRAFVGKVGLMIFVTEFWRPKFKQGNQTEPVKYRVDYWLPHKIVQRAQLDPL